MSNYESREFIEETLCNGVYKKYSSETKECVVEKSGITSVESFINNWLGGYVKYFGSSFTDPAFGKGSYHVIKNI